MSKVSNIQMAFSTGCWFDFGYFDIRAKIGNFHPNLAKYGLFEGKHLRIYDFIKRVLDFVGAKD